MVYPHARRKNCRKSILTAVIIIVVIIWAQQPVRAQCTIDADCMVDEAAPCDVLSCVDGVCTSRTTMCVTAAGTSPCVVGGCDVEMGLCTLFERANGDACEPLEPLAPCEEGAVCQAGVCTAVPRVCVTEDADPCVVHECQVETGACVPRVQPDDMACEIVDTELGACQSGSVCRDGLCTALELTCDLPESVCFVAVCDRELGRCTAIPATDGTVCEPIDASLCHEYGECQSGECFPVPVVCEAPGVLCAVSQCDEATGSCEVVPEQDGTMCTPVEAETDACVISGTCIGGECMPVPRVCVVDSSMQCVEAACDSLVGCVQVSLSDGILCMLDSTVDAPCFSGGVCSGGMCTPAPIECAPVDGIDAQCEFTGCDAETGTCVVQAQMDGTVCVSADETACHTGSQCIGGVCEPIPLICNQPDQPCFSSACVVEQGVCVIQIASDGTPCDGAPFDLCSVGARCERGSCVAEPVRCDDPVEHVPMDSCHAFLCDPEIGECVEEVAHVGGPCGDGLLCTVNDACDEEGVCVGSPRVCGGEWETFSDGVSCVPIEGTGVIGDGSDMSNVYASECAQRECSEICGGCVVSTIVDATCVVWLPDDGLCGIGHCTPHAVTGAPVCSPGRAGDDPVVQLASLGVCDVANPCETYDCPAGQCTVTATALDGLACTDADDPCHVGQCLAGQCTTSPGGQQVTIDCSHMDGPCLQGACVGSLGGGECVAMPLSDVSCPWTGDECVLEAACRDGVCVPVVMRYCNGQLEDGTVPSECQEAVCHTGICVAAAMSDTMDVVNGEDGTVIGQVPRTCVSSADLCVIGMCVGGVCGDGQRVPFSEVDEAGERAEGSVGCVGFECNSMNGKMERTVLVGVACLLADGEMLGTCSDVGTCTTSAAGTSDGAGTSSQVLSSRAIMWISVASGFFFLGCIALVTVCYRRDRIRRRNRALTRALSRHRIRL